MTDKETAVRRWVRTSLLVLLFIIPAAANAQKQEVDAVYLYNGEVFRGKLSDNTDKDLLKIETLCHNTRIFPRSEVQRL